MKKSLILFLILLFLVSFFLRSYFSFFSPLKYWDETIYTNLGRNLVLYHEYSFLHGFADFSSNWPLAGFRPPLLPFLISLIFLFSKKVFFLNLIIPFLSSIGVVGLFFLSKDLIDEEVAIYSSIFLSFFPMNVFFGSKILTDTLFLTMLVFSCFFFCRSFLFNYNKLYNPIFFGIFCGLAFLSRYSMIWIFPVFFFFLLIIKKWKVFYSKDLWYSILFFFIIVGPWFLYNYFIYGSFFGFLVQAKDAALRWGVDPLKLHLIYFIKNFWMLIPFFILGVSHTKNKEKNSVIFMILLFFIPFLFLLFIGHKEERYLLILLPAFVILSSFGLISLKRYKKFLFILLISLFLVLLFFNFLNLKKQDYSESQICSLNTMDYLIKSNVSYIVTEHFSPVYFYTLKPTIRVDNYSAIKSIINFQYPNETLYYYYVEGDWFNLINEDNSLEEGLIFSCDKFKLFDISK